MTNHVPPISNINDFIDKWAASDDVSWDGSYDSTWDDLYRPDWTKI